MEGLKTKLYNDAKSKTPEELTPEQNAKLRLACKKAIVENPNLSYPELLKAVIIYLRFIKGFPDLTL